MPTMDQYAARFADQNAELRSAVSAAEGIMHTVLGFLPDEPGDPRIIRERIQKWLVRDVVKNS